VSLFLVAALPAKEYKGGMGRSEPDADTARRQELASFLRARRAAIQPADVNLYCRPGRRNTPGLRREEVAQISGVGHTWYTWLEQARAITISESVVEALARAFQLDRDAHAHLRHLAGLPASEPEQISEPADADLTRLLDTLMPAPSCALGSRFDFVAWNESFASCGSSSPTPSTGASGPTGPNEVACCSASSASQLRDMPVIPSFPTSSTTSVRRTHSSGSFGVAMKCASPSRVRCAFAILRSGRCGSMSSNCDRATTHRSRCPCTCRRGHEIGTS
jgi:transcriptional regulator with XRE-family HTH domain